MDELKEQGKGKGLAMRKSWEEIYAHSTEKKKAESMAELEDKINIGQTVYRAYLIYNRMGSIFRELA